ncbi:transposase [Candidatus Mycobacterium methanotrophicum]|uniref:transposase n=1 Tax=Candidatus Mycobacterium methanotrophicum TaxID=2943498 RepID=UPI002103DCD2|nr:transposase [Candidatus Mycobacterium methanotrophicum]
MVARVHKTLIWERTRHVLRLRHALREYFPAALEAFEDLDAADTLQLLTKAPGPASAAKLTGPQIRAALKGARRRDIDTKTARIQDALRGRQLGRREAIAGAYAATTRSIVAVLRTPNEQIEVLQGQAEAHSGRHPDAEIIMSQPGMGPLPGAQVLGEFGDAPGRYTDAQARKNYAGTSPITRASGKKKVVAHPVRAQPPAHRRAHAPSPVRATRLTRRPRRLQQTTRPGAEQQRRTTPALQPARRHPARLPQNPHQLQRINRMAPTQRPRSTIK